MTGVSISAGLQHFAIVRRPQNNFGQGAIAPRFGMFSSRKAKFTEVEAKGLADSLVRHDPHLHAPEKEKGISTEDIAKAIVAGKAPPFEDQEYHYGIVMPDGKIKTNDPIFQRIGEYLADNMPSGLLDAQGMPIVVRERGRETFDEVEQFIEKEMIPHFQVDGEVTVTDKKGKDKPVRVIETITWPFFEEVITGKSLTPQYRDLALKLNDLPLFDMRLQTAGGKEDTLQKVYAPLNIRLAALEAATMQYSDRVELKEVMASMLAGSLIGGGGEIMVHQGMPHGGPDAAVARTAILGMVDLIVGMFGEMGVLMSSLEANGIALNKDNIIGKKADGSSRRWWHLFQSPIKIGGTYPDGTKRPLWKILRSPLRLEGKAGIFAKRAVTAATQGAMIGTVMSAPTALALSTDGMPLAAEAAIGGLGSLGTAASLPFNVRSTMPQAYYATMQLIKDGKIPVPDEIKKNDKALKNYARYIAEQDIYSRLGFAASMKAYLLTPLSGLILLADLIPGMPPGAAKTAFMSVAPAMDNLLRLYFTLSRMKLTNPKNIAKAEKMILDSQGRPFDNSETNQFKRLFVDRSTRAIGWMMTRMPPWPVKLSELSTTTAFKPTPDTERKAKPKRKPSA